MEFRLFIRRSVMALAGVWSLSAAAANFPCGTYVIAGLARDEMGKGYDSDDNVCIRAVATNGIVLASVRVHDPYGTANARNFCLSVPLSTVATDQTGSVGDAVNVVMSINGIDNIATQPIVLAQANGGTNLDVRVWNTVSYTNIAGSVTNTAVVSRGYVEKIQPWVESLGYDTYSPFADYDGDGRSNYREYVEGTDPFDETDYLRVTGFSAVAPKTYAISFVYSGGRAYGLSATTDLSKPAWMEKKIRVEGAEAEQDRAVFKESDEDVGVATLYVVPTEGATSEFFNLEVK